MAKIKKDTSLRKAILQAAITGQLIDSCHSEVIPHATCHSEAQSAEESISLTEKQNFTNAKGFIYIVTNKNKTTLYVGVTSNLKKRIWEHKNHVVKGFTDKYNCENLVYFECFLDIKNAIEREKYIKGKKRVFKENLINEINPKWLDLYDYLFTDVSHSLNMTSYPREKIDMTACHSEVIPHATCHSEAQSAEESLETGKQLLDRIIEERNKKLLAEWEEKLKDNPKAKKPTQIVASEIDEEEIPFEIPENWCWCRLGDICYKIGDIDHKMPKEVVDGIPYISPRDFTETDIDFINAKKISQEDFDDLSKKMKPKRGDIIFPRYGTIGTVRLVNVDFNFLVSYSCCTISSMRTFVSENFIFYALQSKHIKDEIEKYINKTTQPNVGLESIKQFLFPLPPLEVQNAIVAKLEQVLPLVDAYENAVLQKEELKAALPDSLKKAILQEAIQGKLTEFWRKDVSLSLNMTECQQTTKADVSHSLNMTGCLEVIPHATCHSEARSAEESLETGKQLLDRIIEERNKKLLAEWEEKLKDNPKAKKPTPIVASEIAEDEIPFEVPESWCWCRLGDLVTILGDGLHGTPQYDISGEYYFVNGNNLNNGAIEIKQDTKRVNKKKFEKYKKDLNDTTIFVSINGTIGNIAFYNNEKIVLGKSACYFNVAIKELKKYFFFLFQTDFFLTYALDNATGTTIKNVGLGTMRNFLIPLPSLAEQEKIVEIIEQMLPLCEKLKTENGNLKTESGKNFIF